MSSVQEEQEHVVLRNDWPVKMCSGFDDADQYIRSASIQATEQIGEDTSSIWR